MTLIFNEWNNLKQQNKPGLHALIVGVSAYPHLKGGTLADAPDGFGMQQLSSTALTAYRIYQWLLERKDKLPVPLATIRLLLSPSPTELAAVPELKGLADPATLANFQAEASDWRTDAGTRPDNFTFFYFAGHGVQRSRDDAVMLLEGFGQRGGGILQNAVDTLNIFNGMAPSDAFPNIAQNQLYFVDACRVLPGEFKKFERLSTSVAFDVAVLSIRDERAAPIFYASIPGTLAYALKGEQTLFSKALLQCLSGAAGDIKDEDDTVKWQVSINSLMPALADTLNDLAKEQRAEQEFTTGGQLKRVDDPIHYLDKAPEVDVTLEVDPIGAIQNAKVQLLDNQGTPVALPHPLAPHPFQCRLPAGFYMISATIEPPDPRYKNVPNRTYLIMPPGIPRIRKTVRVTA